MKKLILILLVIIVFILIGCVEMDVIREEGDMPKDDKEDQVHYRRDTLYRD